MQKLTADAPIGVFDSGLGGLTVVKTITKKLPYENIIYIGDEAHVPYGEKSPDEIIDFALGIIDYFVKSGVKLVVMACNMSSANALDTAKSVYDAIPILGTIEAGARKAVDSRHERIGVLATNGTVLTKAYTKTIKSMNNQLLVIEQACPKFVPLVESDMCDSTEAYEAAHEYVQPLINEGCTSIILGCTHYPYLINPIKAAAQNNTEIIDPAEYTVNQIRDALGHAKLLNSPNNAPYYKYYSTASTESFNLIGSRFMNSRLSAKQISWGIDLRENLWLEKMEEQTINFAQ